MSEGRAAVWRADAAKLVADLEYYEYCHPAASEGVPCLQDALVAAQKALAVFDQTPSDVGWPVS